MNCKNILSKFLIGCATAFTGWAVWYCFSSPNHGSEGKSQTSGAIRYRPSAKEKTMSPVGAARRINGENGVRLDSGAAHSRNKSPMSSGNADVDERVEIARMVLEIAEMIAEDKASGVTANMLSALRTACDTRDIKGINRMLTRLAHIRNAKLQAAILATSKYNATLGPDVLASGADGGVIGGADAGDAGQQVVEADDAVQINDFGAEDQNEVAIREWESKIFDADSDAARISVIKQAMMTLNTQTGCDYFSGKLINSIDKGLAVQAAAEIVAEGSDFGSGAAKTAYKWITGEEWSGQENAKKWANDFAAKQTQEGLSLK